MPAKIANRDEIMAIVIERIAAGEFTQDILAEDGMPDAATFRRWKAADEELARQCARARADAAEQNERSVAELARQVVEGTIEPDAARTAANMHTWLAKVRNPKVYGDRLDVEHSGKVQVIPVLNVSIGPPTLPPIDITPERTDGDER
jgi:uncharacterized protein (DUF885 family)